LETRLTTEAPIEPGQALLGHARKRRTTVTGLGLRVLCVEDDEQVLSILAALLETEGYEVATAATAEAGLAHLASRKFHLVVTDYWLPDRTCAWMLSEASSRGILLDTPVLVITAEHRPQGVENLTILRKPLDLDDFLAIVHESMQPVREKEVEKAVQDMERSFPREGAGNSVRIDLALYISASSPSSLKALRNVNRLLAEYDPAQVRLDTYDLSKEHVPSADEDRIAFTPTLVKRWPEPKMWVLGDLEDATVLADLLGHAGVERNR
jgi:DNA-binding response OmpR family regulator